MAPFTEKSEMVWYFIDVYMIKRRYEMLGDTKLLTRSLCLLVKYFSTLKRNFISLDGHVISSIY